MPLDAWGPYRAEYVDNYDGDSITIRFEVWPDVWVQRAIRLGGIDTPEIKHRAKCDREKDMGTKAKRLVESLSTQAGESLTTRIYGRGKYGRILADLYVGEKNVATELIRAGLARPYHGGKRQGWC